MKPWIPVLLAMALLLPSGTYTFGGMIDVYWSDIALTPNQIQTIGGNGLPETILTGNQPLGLAIGGGFIYWTDWGAEGSKIWRTEVANPLQPDPMDYLVSESSPSSFRGIALDVAGGMMYWADPRSGPGAQGNGKIQRANLDGTGIIDLLTGLSTPQGVALDLPRGKMYWADTTDGIFMANLDGTNKVPVPISGSTDLGALQAIAVDPIAQKIYWTDQGGAGKLKRANLDGTMSEDLVSGLSNPREVEVDLANGKVYWTTAGKIERANLDGTGREDVVIGLVFSYALAITPEPSTITLAGMGLIGLLAYGWRRRRQVS